MRAGAKRKTLSSGLQNTHLQVYEYIYENWIRMWKRVGKILKTSLTSKPKAKGQRPKAKVHSP